MRFLTLAMCLLAPGLLLAVEHAGTVRAADQLIPGATVTARQGGAKLVAYTDESGRYSFDLTPGVWDIEISMFGFKTLTTPITVRDEVVSRNWTLEMPRIGEVEGSSKPESADAKKPETLAATTQTAAPAMVQGGRGGRGGRGQG